MVETLGLPTIFFTHSAADLHWPELARLMCPQDPESSSSRSHALIENPALADCFFYERIQQFTKAFYIDVLGVTDYTGCVLSGSTMEARIFMVRPGCQMHQMLSRYLHQPTRLKVLSWTCLVQHSKS